MDQEFGEIFFANELDGRSDVPAALKWSNPPGHLVKVVILLIEVKYDDREKAAEIHA